MSSGNDRLNSMRLWTGASEFLEAAKIVHVGKPRTISPLYFLLCQSIELALKSYLRGSGADEGRLIKIGHNLDRLVAEAEQSGLASIVSVSNTDKAIISSLNPYYAGKDLQYTTRGFKSYPAPGAVIELVERLLERVQQFAEGNMGRHAGKPTAVI